MYNKIQFQSKSYHGNHPIFEWNTGKKYSDLWENGSLDYIESNDISSDFIYSRTRDSNIMSCEN